LIRAIEHMFPSERRIFDRFSARFPVKIKNSEHEFGEKIFLSDISAQGACIATKQRISIDDEIGILVKLPDGKEPVPLNGRIKWVKDKNPSTWHAGVEFEQINFMTTQRIFTLVSKVVI